MVRPRDEAKQEALLDAALAEVAETGLEALSVDAVARRARVGTGTVYVYFKSKEALVDALYGEVKSEFARLVFQDHGLPVRPGVERGCRAYLEYCATHRRELGFLDQIERSPVFRERTRAATAAAMKPLFGLIERGQAERVVKAGDPELIIAFLAGALRSAADSLVVRPQARREQQIEQLLAMAWDSLAA
jgi:AcrR family transcriptional regulator